MNKYPDINIIVESHTDSRGSSSYNKGFQKEGQKLQFNIYFQGIAETE